MTYLGDPNEPDFLGPFQAGGPEIKRFFDQILNIGLKFRSQPEVKEDAQPTPTSVQFGSLSEQGCSYDELLNEFRNIARGSLHWGSPNWVGFLDSGNSIPSLGAALMVPPLGQNLCNQDVTGPSATFIEMEVVHWLRSNLGYPLPEKYEHALEIGGILTVGGSLSNAIALIAAREALFPGSAVNGLPVLPRDVRVLVPDVIEHYFIRSALSSLSLGGAGVVRVLVDDDFRILLPELERCIDEERASGHHIMACGAYAGDSRTMRIDSLDSIANLLQRKNVWFHVDACHGSSLAFSRTHRSKLRGIEKADSVTIDPHKALWVTYTCSFVLFKNPETLAKVGATTELILKTQWSLGQITPFIGSKAFNALKLWASIKYFGQQGIERLIDKRLDLTVQIQDELKRYPDLLLLNKTDINACVMVFLPSELQKRNARMIKMVIQNNGKFFIHGFPLRRLPHALLPEDHTIFVLRTMNGNPLTTIENIRLLLEEVVRLGHSFWNDQRTVTAKL
ncbi:Cysteine-sulfinate decarboxylase [Cladobotryum mycophilum]|uniref:Cysteine-sulfinate decarboxylase n=1 Tax=Cladobotryum mycophilum TaxID=491253 RepID=A0ABR0SHH3_9HYPO